MLKANLKASQEKKGGKAANLGFKCVFFVQDRYKSDTKEVWGLINPTNEISGIMNRN